LAWRDLAHVSDIVAGDRAEGYAIFDFGFWIEKWIMDPNNFVAELRLGTAKDFGV